MLTDRISNPGPLTYESGARPIALRGPAMAEEHIEFTLSVRARACVCSRIVSGP